MPVAPATDVELLALIRRSGVISAERLTAAVPDPDALPPDPKRAAASLIQKGVITRFQATQLLAGRHKGFRLGAYVVLDVVGRGGMGAVYLAEHLDLHRKVAIKVLMTEKNDDYRLATERFLREARAAAALDHPNIVRIFDVARHNDVPYLVMEYVEGETLQHALDRDGSFPYTTAADYVAQAAAGLQHAHEKGFVHRDIKPGNLIRDRSGTVKILDMGLARSFNSETDKLTEKLDAGAVVGTADFIAPEQALNVPRIDIRADIYSLGASFFALLAGKPPFQGNTTQKLLQHQLKSAPHLAQIDGTLPKGLSAVVAKMLAKKPEDRYQTPAEVIAALAPWLGNSARVLAGISRTNLGQGAELAAALNDRGGVRVLSAVAAAESDVDFSTPEHDTGEAAAAQTTRSPNPPPPSTRVRPGKPAPVPANRKKKVLVFAGLGLGVLLSGGLAAWQASGKNKQADLPPADPAPPDVAKAPPLAPVPTPPGPPPGGTPAPTPPVTPKPPDPPPAASPQVVYKLDLSGQKPFRVRGGHEKTGVQGRDVRFVQNEKTGDGDFPAGWSGMPWDKDSEAEFWAEARDGRPVLGMRNLEKKSAMLLSPDVTVPAARCRVRFEYMTDADNARVILFKFKAAGQSNSVGLKELTRLDGTNGEWRVCEMDVDMKGFPTGFFEWHTFGEPDHAFYLRSFQVAEPGADLGGVAERVVFRLDLGGQKPFAVRSGLEMKDGQKVYRPLSQTGAGTPPPGWVGRAWNVETQMEYFAEEGAGGKALGVRKVRGSGSAMLFMPHFDCTTGVCRVRFEYSAPVRERRFTLRFKPADSRPAWTVCNPPITTGEVWRTEDLVVDLQGARGGFFEFHNSDESPDAALRLRHVVVSEVAAGTPPTVAAAGPPPSGPNMSNWKEGPSVYRLEIDKLAPFRVTKEGGKRLSGEAERLPPGVRCTCWKATAVGEFRCEVIDGLPAIGVTNLSDEKSAQFALELEKEIQLDLKPGRAYRVKLGYMTRNEATGHATVQTQDYKGVASAALPNTGGTWKTATISFVRAEGTPVRLTLDNNVVGEGNTLYFRSVEIIEITDPGK